MTPVVAQSGLAVLCAPLVVEVVVWLPLLALVELEVLLVAVLLLLAVQLCSRQKDLKRTSSFSARMVLISKPWSKAHVTWKATIQEGMEH